MKFPRFKGIRHLRKFIEGLWSLAMLRSDRSLWQILEPILRKSSSTGCTFWELRRLHTYIVQNRPTRVLELGAGVSTVVLAHAAHTVQQTGHECRVVSMEESAFYFQELRDMLNTLPPDIRDRVELVLSETEDRPVSARDGAALIARCYKHKPSHPYDFVFVDGPQIPSREEDARYFDGDVLDVAAWNPGRFTVFLDNRKGTRDILRRICPWAQFKLWKRHSFAEFVFPEQALRGDHAGSGG